MSSPTSDGTPHQIEVHTNDRGAWCVYIDGQFVSDHATHTAARLTAQRHSVPVEQEEK